MTAYATTTLGGDLCGKKVIVTTYGDAGTTYTHSTAAVFQSPSKKAMVVNATVNGQAVVSLLRIHEDKGRIYIDKYDSTTAGALSTLVDTIDLSAIAVGHPSPTEDVADTAALVSGGGS